MSPDRVPAQTTSTRRTAVLVGLLFLSSTVTFAVGANLVEASFTGTAPDPGGLLAGVLLQGYTGLAVAGIGIALFPILRPHGPRLAAGYLGLRLAEGVAIVAAGSYLVTSLSPVPDHDLAVYAFTGLGGLALSALLMRSRLAPRWLSVLGLVGYAALLAGAVFDLLRIIDLGSGAGFAFLVPGGLFEIAFPLLLLVRGFGTTRASERVLVPTG